VADGLEVVRWQRYGKDRLYVNAADGTRIGWHDLQTGASMVDSDEQRDAFFRCVDAELVVLGRQARRSTSELAAKSLEATPAMSAVDLPADASPCGPAAGFACQADPVVLPEHEDPEEERDLADNRAGQLAREQAVAKRAEAPGRTFLARVLRVHTDERAWRIGADGEEHTGARLERLARKDPRWRVLHSVEVGERGSDVDHVVIGPGGVFTLNTKHSPSKVVKVRGDSVRVNGYRQPWVRNSRHEATRAARLLSAATGREVAAIGIIVLVRVADQQIAQQPTDVWVMNRWQVVRFLRGRPEVLDAEAVEALYAAARRPSTWKPT
jgi:hypothetical protein